MPEKRLNKPELGHLKKAGLTPKKHLKEFRLEDISEYKVGDTVTADVFSEGERVDVTGISKGHGFSGVIKRWNARKQNMSHGKMCIRDREHDKDAGPVIL